MPQSTQKVGIYGGTFDPVHFGHLNLALELMEAHQLDAVFFCPVFVSPHRLERPPLEARHRLNMTALAIEPIPSFHLLDWECRQGGVSYSVDTLRWWKEEEKRTGLSSELYFLLGEDSLKGLPTWRELGAILQMAQPLIGSRCGGEAIDSLPLKDSVKKILKKGLTSTRILEISGTEIRQRLKEGKYCGHLLPRKVIDYIFENRLYLT